MRKLSRDRALALIEPHKERFWRICEESWERWMQHPDRTLLHPRTRANLIYDWMLDAARREFAGVPSAEFVEIESKGLTMLRLDGQLLVRFKKLDESRMPRNYPTRHAREYNLQMSLPEIPAATRVFCGYRLNKFETEIRDVSITCTNGAGIAWYIDIEPAEPSVIRLPEPDASRDVAATRPRVRIRRTEIQSDLAL
jgi:hypothetical protein